MPCQQCTTGKWKWGSQGECKYESEAACEAENKGKALAALVDRLYGNPLLLPPQNARLLEAAATNLADLAKAFGLDDVARWNPFAPRLMEGGVSVIGVSGTLMRSFFFDDYADLQEAFDASLEDPRVRSILLSIDSPGGDAAGCFDLSDHIHASRGRKPLVALANAQATSAAYALGSAADEFWGSRDAITGSIGVFAMHVDRSKWNEKQGYAVTEIAAGKHKLDLSRNKPLGAAGRETLTRLVESTMDVFVATVARNREISEDAIRAQEAAIYLGPEEAREQGLLEGRSDLKTLIERLAGQGAGSSPQPAASAARGDAMGTEQTPKGDAQPEKAQPPQAATGSGSTGNVVDLDAARQQGAAQAREEEKQRREEIREVCELARVESQKIVEYLESGKSAAEVRRLILDSRASDDAREPETDVHHRAAPGTSRPKIEAVSSIYARRRREVEAFGRAHPVAAPNLDEEGS